MCVRVFVRARVRARARARVNLRVCVCASVLKRAFACACVPQRMSKHARVLTSGRACKCGSCSDGTSDFKWNCESWQGKHGPDVYRASARRCIQWSRLWLGTRAVHGQGAQAPVCA
eukprot:3355234-Pleurochrysis_carterae.AAC.1